MPGFTVSDGSALGSPALQGQDRNAAIAAMGQRLAAAGLRMRQRNVPRNTDRADIPVVAPDDYEDRTPFAPDVWVDRDLAEWAARVPPERNIEFDTPHWRDYLGTARQVATLGATGACGFALVIFALRFGAVPRPAGPGARTVEVAQVQTASAGREAAPAAPAAVAPVPVVVPRQEARTASATLRLPSVVPAVVTVAMPAPSAAVTTPIAAPHAQTPRRVVETVRRTDTVTARVHARRAAPGVVARAAARPHAAPSRLAMTHDSWPRWLTEDQASRPRIIMSEPPHNLTQPADMGGQGAIADAAPARTAPPAVRRAPVVVASSGYGAAGGGGAVGPSTGLIIVGRMAAPGIIRIRMAAIMAAGTGLVRRKKSMAELLF